MKNLFRSFFCVALLSVVGAISASSCGLGGCCTTSCDSCCTTSDCCSEPKTLWFPRSAGDNLVLDAHRFGYQYNEDCCTYGNFGVSYRYQRSFRGERIAQSLFGTNGLTFVGSQDTTRTTSPATVAANALLADYFGLSHKQNAISVSYCPRIQNHCIDFRLYVGMEELLEGLYMQLNLPVIHTKWNLSGGNCNSCCDDCCNTCCNTCTTTTTGTTTSCGIGGCTSGTVSTVPFPAGYMSSVAKPAVPPVATLQEALDGKAFGDFQGRTYGKFSGCCDDTKLAGIYFDLGYNFWECPDYHLGVYLKVIAPAGVTDMNCDAHAKQIFYPVVGDYHWQLGGGISGHAELYNCEDDHVINAYLQGYVTHLFEREQIRSFDLTNGVMSRYMLMKEYKSATDKTYNDKLWSVIDWSTRKAKVKVDVKGEGMLEFVYSNSCGFSAGLGYEIYGRSKEKICTLCNPCNSAMQSKTLGLKGCAPVGATGYYVNATPAFIEFAAATRIASVAATQSDATAYKCGTVDSAKVVSVPNPITGALNDAAYVNPLTFVGPASVASINDSHLSESSSTDIIAIATTGAVTTITPNPTLLTDAKINKCSAALNGYITNKVFGHIDYVWDECDWKPSIYAGAEGEFASCSDRNAMNAWGVWIGGALAF